MASTDDFPSREGEWIKKKKKRFVNDAFSSLTGELGWGGGETETFLLGQKSILR